MRTFARTVLVGLAVAALLATGAAPAHASHWVLSDGSVGDPYRWTIYSSGDGGGNFQLNPDLAHSGQAHTYLWARTGFSSVHRNVHITPAETSPHYFCNASFWIKKIAAPVNLPVHVNVEIINPVGWTTLAFNWTYLYESQGWQRIWTGTWDADQVDVVARAAVVGEGVRRNALIDDFYITCQQIPS